MLIYLLLSMHQIMYLLPLSLVSSTPPSLTFVTLCSHAFPFDCYNSLQIWFSPNLTLWFDFLTLSFRLIMQQPYYDTCTSLNMMQSPELKSLPSLFPLWYPFNQSNVFFFNYTREWWVHILYKGFTQHKNIQSKKLSISLSCPVSSKLHTHTSHSTGNCY